MSRLHANAVSGVLSSSITNSATSIASAGLANLPVVAGSDTALIILDPDGAANGPEAVWVTAHTSSATTATVTRAAETGGGLKATGQAHASGTKWVHAMSVTDFTGGTPQASAPGDVASAGASGQHADKDHKHGREAFGAVGDIHASAPGDSAAAGASAKVADAAHVHAREAFALSGDLAAVGTTAAAGTGTKVPRNDHVHAIGAGAINNTNQFGSAVVPTAAMVAAFWSEFVVEQRTTCSAPLTVTATTALTAQAVPSTLQTVAITRTGQIVVIHGVIDVEYTGGGTPQEAVTNLWVDGAGGTGGAASSIIGFGNISGVKFRVTPGQVWLVSGLSVGNHTFELRALKLNSGDTVKINNDHTSLTTVRYG